MPTELLKLEDREFWVHPFRTELEVARTLRQQAASGVRIDGPGFVAVDARQTLPVVLCRCGEIADLWGADLLEHGLITAVDLETNLVRASRVLQDADAAALGRGPIPDASPPAGFEVQMKALDLRRLLALDWNPGRLLVTALLRERVSNRLEIRLGRSPGAFHDPAVDEFLQARRAQLQPVAHPPLKHPYPNYFAKDDSPPVPDGFGLHVTGDRVVTLMNDAQCILRGAYRLPVLPQEVVKAAEGSRRPSYNAVLGITLLVTAADRAVPMLIRLDVPSYTRLDPQQQPMVAAGHFALDLLALEGMPRRPRTYLVYAFSGREMAGPHSVTLLARERVPGRGR